MALTQIVTTDSVSASIVNTKIVTPTNNSLTYLEGYVDALNINDNEARQEILDIKLKLEEAAVIDFLNKTGVGFYDLFADTSNVDAINTTATVSGGDVTFAGAKILQMDSQTFSDFTGVDLALYDKERVIFTITVNVTDSNTISMDIAPGSRTIGEKFFYNGEVYTITNVVEV